MLFMVAAGVQRLDVLSPEVANSALRSIVQYSTVHYGAVQRSTMVPAAFARPFGAGVQPPDALGQHDPGGRRHSGGGASGAAGERLRERGGLQAGVQGRSAVELRVWMGVAIR